MDAVCAFGAADMLLRPVSRFVLPEAVRGVVHDILLTVVNYAVIRSRAVIRDGVPADRYLARFGSVENEFGISECFKHFAVDEKFASFSDVDCLAHFLSLRDGSNEIRQIFVYFVSVGFVEDLVTRALIQFDLYVVSRFGKPVVHFFYAFSVIADGIVRSRDKQNGFFLIDGFKPLF